MEKGIILYQSKYGATEKYAQWLRDALGFDMVQTKAADVKTVLAYDTILLGGGVYASGIAGISFLKKHIGKLAGKKIAVFCVGASPYDQDAVDQMVQRHFAGQLQGIPLFYCRGAWNEEKMSFSHRTLCKMLQKAVSKQDPATYEPWQAALMSAIGQSRDWTDRAYLEPLIAYVQERAL